MNNFVVTVTVAHKGEWERILSRADLLEIFAPPQVGQDLIVAVNYRGAPYFFNVGQVTMVDMVDHKDGREYRVEIPLTKPYPVVVSLSPWVTRPAVLLESLRRLEEKAMATPA